MIFYILYKSPFFVGSSNFLARRNCFVESFPGIQERRMEGGLLCWTWAIPFVGSTHQLNPDPYTTPETTNTLHGFLQRGERHGRMVWWCLWLVCVYASSPRRCNSVTVSFCIGLNSICPWGWKWWIWASMVCASIDPHCVDIYMIIHVIVYVYNIRYCIRQISSHVMWNVMQRLENTNDHGTSHSSHLTTLLEALLTIWSCCVFQRPSGLLQARSSIWHANSQLTKLLACLRLQWPKLWIMAYEQMILEHYRSATALVLPFPGVPSPFFAILIHHLLLLEVTPSPSLPQKASDFVSTC